MELLEALPGWRWSGTYERQWQARLDALRRYAARNGTCAVPPGVVVGRRMRLGDRVAAQKASQAAGTLPRPAAELLEQVPDGNGGNRASPRRRRLWTIVLDALRRKLGTGEQDEFDDGPPEAFPHDQWIRRLRYDYRNGALPPAVVAQAEALPGWSWNPGEANWERGLHALQAWTSVHRGACPPQAAVMDGFPSGAGYTPDAASTAQASCPQTGPRSSRHFRDGSGTSSTRRGRTHWTRCVPMRQSMARPTFRRATQPEACSSASGCVTSVWCTAGDSSLRVASP